MRYIKNVHTEWKLIFLSPSVIGEIDDDDDVDDKKKSLSHVSLHVVEGRTHNKW